MKQKRSFTVLSQPACYIIRALFIFRALSIFEYAGYFGPIHSALLFNALH
jgi:hypothetical protein